LAIKDRLLPATRVAILAIAAIALAGWSAAHSGALPGGTWHLDKSSNFVVMTDLDADRATALIANLELFRSAVLARTGIEAVPERLPARVVVFSELRDFVRVSGERDSLGFMRPSLRGNRMVAGGGSLSIDTRNVLFHEYVHHLLRSSLATRYPTWYDEGLADLLSTADVDDDAVVFGAVARSRLAILREERFPVPLARVVNEDDLSDWHPRQVSYFYGMAWALTSYLHAEHPDALARYLDDTARGVPREEAFERAFGIGPVQMEKRVRRFHERRRRSLERLPVAALPAPGVIDSRLMPNREVAYELAFLAMFDRPEYARELLEEQLAIAPQDVHLASALAITYQAEERFEEGVAMARAAWLRAPDDPVLGIDLADMLMVWNDDVCADDAPAHPDPACAGRYEEATRVYRRAWTAAPTNPEVNAGLAWSLERRGVELEAARGHIDLALEYQPWASYLLLRRGLISKGLGDASAARADLERALYWAESDELRDQAAEGLAALGATP
jgi:tetratricopeptide (TPR) repeat protein